jgi:hypothetical protein
VDNAGRKPSPVSEFRTGGWLTLAAAALLAAGLCSASAASDILPQHKPPPPGQSAAEHSVPTHGTAAGHGAAAGHGGHGEHGEETPPETFMLLEIITEAFEAGFAGPGIKLAELNPKLKGINDLYSHGEAPKAWAKILGIATEVVLAGFLLEITGVAELAMAGLSLSGNWMAQLAESAIGIMLVTKTALVAGETVEEAAEERFAHANPAGHRQTAEHKPGH